MRLSFILPWFLFSLLTNRTNQCTSTRILEGSSKPQHAAHQHIAFFMQNVLDYTKHWSNPTTGQVNGQFPFKKPIGLFPPNEGMPLPDQPNPTQQPYHPMDPTHIGLPFPALATLQGLKVGTVTVIDEELIQGDAIVGKAKGVYVASSDDGSSHILAMSVKFVDNDFKDSLKFFGIFEADISESHIAIIGGTGMYQGANGYATIKGMNVSSVDSEQKSVGNFLLFTVYLSS